MKLCWLINDRGAVVTWDWNTANVHDQTFLTLIEPWVEQTIVLADTGVTDADGIPANLKRYRRGSWNERMLVESTRALTTGVFGLKKVFHRTCVTLLRGLPMLSHCSTHYWRSTAYCSLTPALLNSCISLSSAYELAPTVSD